jgi:hypothetical protein
VCVVLATPNYGTPAWIPFERVDTRTTNYVGRVLESGVVGRTFCEKGGDGRPRSADVLSLLGRQLVDDVPDIRHVRPDCHAARSTGG